MNDNNGVIISLCDLTGAMVEPWVKAGYRAILVDPQHPEGVTTEGLITKIGHIIDHPDTWRVIGDAIRNDRVVFVAGFPPCTDLAVSGARWFEDKRAKDPAFQLKAMQVVWQCQVIGELSGAPWLAENPVSQISTLWRKPDSSFHPHDFTKLHSDDNYTKKTCLWTGGGFVMPTPRRDEALGKPDNRIHFCSPGTERANIRSATPRGFAQAVFELNAPHLKLAPADSAANEPVLLELAEA